MYPGYITFDYVPVGCCQCTRYTLLHRFMSWVSQLYFRRTSGHKSKRRKMAGLKMNRFHDSLRKMFYKYLRPGKRTCPGGSYTIWTVSCGNESHVTVMSKLRLTLSWVYGHLVLYLGDNQVIRKVSTRFREYYDPENYLE